VQEVAAVASLPDAVASPMEADAPSSVGVMAAVGAVDPAVHPTQHSLEMEPSIAAAVDVALALEEANPSQMDLGACLQGQSADTEEAAVGGDAPAHPADEIDEPAAEAEACVAERVSLECSPRAVLPAAIGSPAPATHSPEQPLISPALASSDAVVMNQPAETAGQEGPHPASPAEPVLEEAPQRDGSPSPAIPRDVASDTAGQGLPIAATDAADLLGDGSDVSVGQSRGSVKPDVARLPGGALAAASPTQPTESPASVRDDLEIDLGSPAVLDAAQPALVDGAPVGMAPASAACPAAPEQPATDEFVAAAAADSMAAAEQITVKTLDACCTTLLHPIMLPTRPTVAMRSVHTS
jgi:hypothetical protein